jgi:cytochrome c556
MKLVTKFLVVGLMCAAGVAIAGEATDPTVKARQDLMGTIGMNMKVLGDMAGAKTAYDAAAAEAAKAAIVAAASETAAKFEPQATDPASKSKPEIWTNWDDFVAKDKALIDAASAWDVSSPETIGAGMGAVGGACKDCHMAYRAS